MLLSKGRVPSPEEETRCDYCGTAIHYGETYYVDMHSGRCYCGRSCATLDPPAAPREEPED